MTQKPLISVITITFNAAETLPATLSSVASQSFKDFEHLIIDGASTDDTLSIARREGVAGLRLISEPDNGLYDAMNKGLRYANGEYVVFLNAGDAFHSKDTLAQYAKAAAAKADIIYGDTVIVDSERNVIGPRHLSAPDVLHFKSFSKGMLICHQAFMVRRKIAPQYDLSYRFSADYDWTIRCIKNTTPSRCVNLKQVTIDYLSDGMTDKNKIASLKERFHIMTHYYGLIPTLSNHVAFIGRAFKRGKL